MLATAVKKIAAHPSKTRTERRAFVLRFIEIFPPQFLTLQEPSATYASDRSRGPLGHTILARSARRLRFPPRRSKWRQFLTRAECSRPSKTVPSGTGFPRVRRRREARQAKANRSEARLLAGSPASPLSTPERLWTGLVAIPSHREHQRQSIRGARFP